MHRNLIEPLWEALKLTLEHRRNSDVVIRDVLKANPRWGARDRQEWIYRYYEILRYYLRWQFPVIHRELEPQPQWVSEVWLSFEAFQKVHQKPCWFQPHLTSPPQQEIFRQLERQWKQGISMPRAAWESWPAWLDDNLEKLIPNWSSWQSALNQVAPLDLRVNTLKISVDEFCQLIEKKYHLKVLRVPRSRWAVELPERLPVFHWAEFRLGFFEVQDRASQKVVEWVDPQPGEQILDACAGAGGKTLALAAAMENRGKIVAFDVWESKLHQLRQRCRRAGVQNVEARLVRDSKVWKRQKGRFHRVLCDVPCSGLGVVRRHPERKYFVTPGELERLIQLQRQILSQYSQLVRPQGRLIYATCSIHPYENQHQIEWFLSQNPRQWRLVSTWTSQVPQQEGDGFFVAILERQNGTGSVFP